MMRVFAAVLLSMGPSAPPAQDPQAAPPGCTTPNREILCVPGADDPVCVVNVRLEQSAVCQPDGSFVTIHKDDTIVWAIQRTAQTPTPDKRRVKMNAKLGASPFGSCRLETTSSSIACKVRRGPANPAVDEVFRYGIVVFVSDTSQTIQFQLDPELRLRGGKPILCKDRTYASPCPK